MRIVQPTVMSPHLDYRRYFSDLLSGIFFIVMLLYIRAIHYKLVDSYSPLVVAETYLRELDVINNNLYVFLVTFVAITFVISPAIGVIVNALSFVLLGGFFSYLRNKIYLDRNCVISKFLNYILRSLFIEYGLDDSVMDYLKNKFKIRNFKLSDFRIIDLYLNVRNPQLYRYLKRYSGIGIFFRNLSFCFIVLSSYFVIQLALISIIFMALALLFSLLALMAFLTDEFEICRAVYVYDNFNFKERD